MGSLEGSCKETKVVMATSICTVALKIKVVDVTAFS